MTYQPTSPNHALQRTPGFGVQLPGAALIRPAQSRAVLPAMKPGTARAFALRRRAHSRAPGPESLSLGSLGHFASWTSRMQYHHKFQHNCIMFHTSLTKTFILIVSALQILTSCSKAERDTAALGAHIKRKVESTQISVWTSGQIAFDQFQIHRDQIPELRKLIARAEGWVRIAQQEEIENFQKPLGAIGELK